MNFSTGEIIDTFIPLRKVEYCTECLVHIIFKYMRMLVKSYIGSVAEGSCSGADPIRSGVADLGAQGGFLRQANARAAERPTRSQQLCERR